MIDLRKSCIINRCLKSGYLTINFYRYCEYDEVLKPILNEILNIFEKNKIFEIYILMKHETANTHLSNFILSNTMHWYNIRNGVLTPTDSCDNESKILICVETYVPKVPKWEIWKQLK